MNKGWMGPTLAIVAALAAVGAVVAARWARHAGTAVAAGGAAADRAVASPTGLDSADAATVERVGPGKAVLGGEVVDAGGGGIAGAVVRAYPEGEAPAGEPIAVAVTDDAGSYRLRGLRPGEYRLEVVGPGVFPATVRMIEAPADAVRVIAARKLTLVGAVTDEGAPVPRATVALTDAGLSGVREAKADDAGRFEITDLVEGEYQVWAYTGDRVAPAQTLSRYGAGPFQPLALELGPGAIARGRVVDAATGRGVAAWVALTDEAGEEPPRSGRADDEGRFAIAGVPRRTWVPVAYAPGFVTTETLLYDPVRVDDLRIELHRGGIAAGRVVDAAGAPIEGAVVALVGVGRGGTPVAVDESERRRQWLRFGGGPTPQPGTTRLLPRGELGVLLGPLPFAPPLGTTVGSQPLAVVEEAALPEPADPQLASRFRTDAEGRWRVAGLAAGTYTARIAHPSYAPAASSEFEVSVGGAIAVPDVRLVPGLVIRGVVRGPSGEPIAGATVSAETADGAPVALALSAPDGRYRLRPIATDVILRANAADYGTSEIDVRIDGLTTQLVEREIDIELVSAGAALTGRVVDPLDHPIADATVSVSAPKRRTATTGTDGQFTLRGVADGEHDVTVEARGYPPLRTTARTGVPTDLELVYGGGVRLDVRDAHTKSAIAAGSVRARGPKGTERTASIDGGDALLVPLRAGRWRLVVDAPAYAPATIDIDVPAGDEAEAITVRDRVVELERGATIAGTVYDVHGQRAAAATVSVGGRKTRADGDGRFRLADVPTGDVDVAATKDGARGSITVPLRPGDELVTLEIQLEP